MTEPNLDALEFHGPDAEPEVVHNVAESDDEVDFINDADKDDEDDTLLEYEVDLEDEKDMDDEETKAANENLCDLSSDDE